MTQESTTLSSTALAAIVPVSGGGRTRGDERQLQLTKPPGSMGALESLGSPLSAVAGACPPPVPAARASRCSPATTACTPRA